jgi:hypothetical protein
MDQMDLFTFINQSYRTMFQAMSTVESQDTASIRKQIIMSRKVLV